MSGIPSWARPGERVVCIRADWNEVPGAPARLPMINEVLTIKKVLTKADYPPGIIDVEVVLSLRELGHDWTFNVRCFRPLVTEQDDLETHFYQYLKTDHRATQKTEERA